MKNNWLKRFLASVLCLALLAGLMPMAYAAETPVADILNEMTAAEAENAEAAVDPEAWVTVIVDMGEGTTLDVDEYITMYRNDSVGYAADSTVAAYRAELVDQQNEMQVQINAINNDATFKYHYTNLLNGFAAKVQVKDIEAIESLEGVEAVYECQTYSYDESWATPDAIDSIEADSGSIEQMGLQKAWDAGYTGAGKLVAVFDSSLYYYHDMFQYMDPAIKAKGEAGELSNYMTQERLLNTVTANKDSMNLFVSDWGCWFHGWAEEGNEHSTGFSAEMQEQFLQGVFGTDARNKDKVPFAVDYCCGDMDAWDGDTSSHGSHVSGIAAGNAGPDNIITTVNQVKGGAYDAQLLFFKIFCEDDPNGQECDEAVFAALDDAVTLGVDSFNLSLGIPNGFSTMKTYSQAGYQKAYNRAAMAGITMSLAAGNDARDAHSGALVSGYTTVLPNSYTTGFSDALYSVMSIASAQGTGYISVTKTSVATVNIDGTATTVSITDNNADGMVGNLLPGVYTAADLVVVGAASEAEILAATGAESLQGALAGKIALANRGSNSSTNKQRLNTLIAAGAAGAILANTSNSNSNASASYLVSGIPAFGFMGLTSYNALTAALAEGKEVTVSFSSTATPRRNTYSDSGPSSFTSWGVSEALDLQPDIMAPGGTIYSVNCSNPHALATMSGTSMASPNSEGAFTVIQQYIDENLETFGVQKGTIEYSILFNELAASAAVPYVDNTGHYFSPRRQGSGMVNVANAINTFVVIGNDQVFDSVTGEAPRANVNLRDHVGDTFDITFNVTNYGATPQIFDIAACVQTDSTTTSGGRDILRVSSGATPGDTLPATITVSDISGDAVVLVDSENIDSYTEGTTPVRMVINKKTNVKVTVTVALDAEGMKAFDAKYPNGMFVEGFIRLNGVGTTQSIGLPYMGFRGDWNQAPLFDFANAYTDISEKATTDLDYPLYHNDTLNSTANGSTVVLGANQFTGAALPTYYATSSVAKTRTYLDTLRAAGNLSADFVAISPNGDGNNDAAYAAIYLLRNTKAVVVTVTDAEGNVIKTMGPEYEYFETYNGDGNTTQQVMMTSGTKYKHNMAWDGTDAEGKKVADGQYNYNVYGITEYDYLSNCGYNAADADVATYVLNAPSAQSVSFPVKVDTTAPVVVATVEGDTLSVAACDDNTIQAVAVYAADKLVGKVALVNAAEYEATVDVSELDPETLTVQVCDYAMNVTTAQAEIVKLEITKQPVDYAGAIGDNAVFTVETNSDSATYQWFYSNNGWSWSKSSMAGNTTNELTVEMKAFRVGQQYKCVVTGADGTVLESDVVTMKYATELAIVENPVDSKLAVNETATFSVVAQGEGLTYQWMYSNNGGKSWSKSTAPGATTASMSIQVKAFRVGQMYKCVVTDANGNVVESESAVIGDDPALYEIQFNFANAEEGYARRMAQTKYWDRLTQNDLNYRLHTGEGTKEAFAELVKSSTQDFTEAQVAMMTQAIADMEERIYEMGFRWPIDQPITFITTTMKEEGGATAFTHGTEIYISSSYLTRVANNYTRYKTSFQVLLAHEMFHVLSRNVPALRAQMYQVFGFTVDQPIPFAPEVANRIISNPDVEDYDCYATFMIDGKPQKATIVLWAPDYDPEHDTNFFTASGPWLVLVDEPDHVLSIDAATDLYDQIGRNTGYIDAIEECVADNYSYAIGYGMNRTYKNPEKIEAILDILANFN